MSKIRTMVLLLGTALVLNAIVLFCSFFFGRNLYHLGISISITLVILFSTLLLTHKKLNLFRENKTVMSFGFMLTLAIVQALVFLPLSKNHYYKNSLKEVSLLQLYTNKDKANYVKLGYDSLFRSKLQENIVYTNKSYEGEFATPLKLDKYGVYDSILPWIYSNETFGYKTKQDLRQAYFNNFNPVEIEYFTISSNLTTALDLDIIENTSKNLGYNNYILLSKVDPTHNNFTYNIAMLCVLIFVNIGYLILIAFNVRKKD